MASKSPRRRSRATAIALLSASWVPAVALGLPATTWDGLTFNFDQSVPSDSNVEVYNGLTLDAALRLQNGYQSTVISFVGSQTLDGSGTVIADNGASSNIHYLRAVDGTLTIAPTITIRTGTGSLAVGNYVTGSVLNLGTLSAQTAGKFLRVNPGVTFTNQGTLLASNNSTLYVTNLSGNLGSASATTGGTLDIDGTYTNDQDRTLTNASQLILRGIWTNTANISLNSASLSLFGNWSNAGNISAVNSFVTLGGNFTTDNLGSFSRTGGSVLIAGTLDNTGRTLSLNASTGSWQLDGGTILNGTVTTSGGATLLLSQYKTSILDHVTLQTDITIPENTTLAARNGLTIVAGHRITLSDGLNGTGYGSRTLNFDGGGTLAGSGEVVFDSMNSVVGVIRSTSGPLTIAPNITVHTGTSSGYIGDAAVDLVNQGSIIANSFNRSITLSGAHVRNEGLLQVAYASNLFLRGNWTNAGTIRIDEGGTLELAGSFSTDGIGTIIHTNPAGGLVRLSGSLDNTGHTVSLTQTLGPWQLFGGTITGGTITGPVTLHTGSPSFSPAGTLDSVTLAGDLTIPAAATLAVRNGLTLATGGHVTLSPTPDNPATLNLVGAQTLDGPGDILFSSSLATAHAYLRPSSGALTLGPSLLVRATGLGTHTIGDTSLPLTNYGTISSQSTSASISLDGSAVTNYGTIEARDGGSVTLSGNWTNPGLLRASNAGTLNLKGLFTTAALGSFTGITGNVVVNGGRLDNTNPVTPLTLSASTGPLCLANEAIISAGNINSSDGTPIIALSGNSYLDAVSLLTNAVVRSGANFQFRNGATATDRTISLAATSASLPASFRPAPAEPLPDNLTVSFDGTVDNNFLLPATNAPLLIPATTTVRTGVGSGTIGSPSSPLTNSGTISAETVNQNLTITGANWANLGTLQVNNGATLNLGGTFTPASIGTVSVSNNGALNVTGYLDATSTPLALSAALPLALAGGTITGTINSADATPLLASKNASSFSVATVNAPVSVLPGATLNAVATTLNQPITITGGTLSLSGVWANNSSITATANSTVSLSSTTPASVGTISLTDSTLRITSSTLYTTALIRPVSLTNSKINVGFNAVFDNTSDTLALSPSTATLILGPGSLKGGTITGPANTPVVFTAAGSTGTLNAVTLAADAQIVPSSTLSISNGLILDNAHLSLQGGSTSSGSATLSFSGTQTLAGTGDISFDGTTGSNIIRVASPVVAVLTVSPNITIHTGTHSGTVGASVSNGLLIQGTLAAQTPAKSLTASGSSITNAGSMTATNSSTLIIDASSFTNTGTITVDPTATLIISGGAASNPNGIIDLSGIGIFNYTGASPADTVRQQLALGRAGVTGIILPEATSDPTRTIGYAEASTLLGLSGTKTATWSGQTVDATTLLLMPTLSGDANFDGLVTPDDYALLDRGFAQHLTGWTNGDFNYDNTVDAADYLLIDTVAAKQAGSPSPVFLAMRESQFGTEYVRTLLAAVPEPSCFALLAVALPAVTSRRRRR